MYKQLFITFLLISLGDCTLGDKYFENSSGQRLNNIQSHTDNIYAIYNDSCIETVNYLYLFYNSPDNENITEAWENTNIWLENITQIGPKAFRADIYYLD